MFRSVTLPRDISGRLYLHSMPGRNEAWSDFIAEAERCSIQVIVCLATDNEIEMKSPSYEDAIKSGRFSYCKQCFPISDYSVPQDREEYTAFVERIARLLRSGHTVLVHCGAGIGRTGTFAICLLLALGLNRVEAHKAIRDAGSSPETKEQREMVSWCEEKFHAA
ncbi:MAG: tyrosine-protein phosphatase [Candidatus Methanomethyliaceae archaeon]